MTTRTIDINCNCCRTYLFSLWADNYKDIEKDYYCKNKKCQEALLVAKLKGDNAESDT